jgi:hypothetical protein
MKMKNYLFKMFFLSCFLSLTAQQSLKTVKKGDLEQIQNTLNDELKGQFTDSDLDSWVVQSDASSRNADSWYYYLAQTHNGIPVRNSIAVVLKNKGKFKIVNTRFINNLETRINVQTPSLSPQAAVLKALSHYKLNAQFSLKIIEKDLSTGTITFAKTDDLQSDIKVHMVYEPTKDGKVTLAWNVNLDLKNGSHWWNTRIDATAGSFVSDNDWVVSCNWSNESSHKHKHASAFSKEVDFTGAVYQEALIQTSSGGVYRVLPYYIESPNHGDFAVISGPENAVASPNGWHDDVANTYTTTRGNNVIARDDQDGLNSTLGPLTSESSPGLVFDYLYGGPSVAASTYIDAASTQLFYMSNAVHDIYYNYGFDEASGNFQENNFGNGGTQGDAVNADVQDGSGLNNANFSTPGDGGNGRMQMFLWNQGAYNPDEALLLSVNNTVLAGDYGALDNAFTQGYVPVTSAITSNLVLVTDDNTGGTNSLDVNDGCGAITNAAAINGKIAVVRRGACAFTLKVKEAQNAGALAVLIVNNVAGNITMGGGDFSITIPAYSLNQADGDALISQMAISTVNATFNVPSIPPPFVNVDGSFDNGVVGHEYGHGINIRLVGGRNNSGCVTAVESMGEGWADFIGKIITLKNIDNGISLNGVGTFVVGQSTSGQGIRPAPYSGSIANNPMTYQALINDPTNGTFTIPHGVGSVWAGMLWDLTWDLIAINGFTDDIYDSNGIYGNTIALNLVIEAMKLTRCNPGFIDGRDAILEADDVLYGNGFPGSGTGANQCVIWSAFARRGLGANASQGGGSSPFDFGTASTSDGNADFSLPTGIGCNPDFLIDNADDASQQICQGVTATSFEFVFYEQNGYDFPTAFVASGLPSGAVASFSPATMNDTGIFTMTISGIPASTTGSFPVTITPGGDASKSKMVDLFVNTSNPNLLDGDTIFSINAGVSSAFFDNSTIPVSTSDNLDLTIPSSAFNGTVLWTAPNGATFTTSTVSFTNIQDNDTAVEGNWSAEFTFTNDCGNTLAPQIINFIVDIDGALGVTSFDLDQILLFPNPTKNRVTITGLKNLSETNISIIDIMGRILSNNVTVNEISANRISLDMSQLSSGTYFIEIKSKENRTVKKLIKN